MTVSLWRIAAVTPVFKAEDISGGGAKATGGRWNAKGVAVLYTSENRSLACLETLVHVSSGGLPLNRILVRLDVPDEVWLKAKVFDPRLPMNIGWDTEPAGMVSIETGTDWLSSGVSSLMVVPSAIIPEEVNVLINPSHPDTSRIVATKVRRWTYDPRLKS
ncbi:RES family NAD+ phosphorylase [Caballeronia novacaledonica]|uniref:RES family NAD+ phosphorylase n=1 Tax=Caballeronia novacaledonica TaxID=1544861 RepID=A0AA37MSZ4_9BURK|nr:RES family NAD+ phosphorylase [Caballeronia novacaledonica]GJH26982.1 RES family NAD+ phosphorylase [Caballeronia novacaledonica]